MSDTETSGSALAELAPSFSGVLLHEGDAGYEEARMVWNGQIDRAPRSSPVAPGCRT